MARTKYRKYQPWLSTKYLRKKLNILIYVGFTMLFIFIYSLNIHGNIVPRFTDFADNCLISTLNKTQLNLNLSELSKCLSLYESRNGLHTSVFSRHKTLEQSYIYNRLKVLLANENNMEPQSFKSMNYINFTCNERNLDNMQSIYKVFDVNCAKIFSGDKKEIMHAVNITKHRKRQLLSNNFYLDLTENCAMFRAQRGYLPCSLTYEEEQFPLAYSMLVYKDVEMVERLLRSIYRPQNYYCIHVDKKADSQFLQAVSAITKCFENVFLAPERISVIWGTFNVLEPELLCMEYLWRYKKWKYFINLTGQEFPLKTNYELVQILMAYNGANDIEGTVKRAKKSKWKSSPPYNLTAVKGSVHIVANRDYIDFILHNPKVKEILYWVNRTNIPDETFFATLNHNPQLGIKGSYKGVPETTNYTSMVKPFLTRFKNWRGPPFDFPCAGYYYRGLCNKHHSQKCDR